MKNKLSLTAIALAALMTACSSKNETITSRVELPGTIDEEAFAANVESISVMNLQMDDCWTLSEYSYTELTDNYLYMLDQRHLQLTCFDLNTGKILSSRSIKGNGPGEVISVSSTFCIGDTLCVYDYNGVNKYDHNCQFVGKIQEFKKLGTNSFYLIRQKCGNLVHIIFDNNLCDTAGAALILTDKSFNVLSRHFATPHFNIGIWGGPQPCYASDDTICFLLSNDNHIYTLRGSVDECIELVVPNPSTPKIAGEIFSKGEHSRMNDYDDFWGLAGSGRFIVLRYRIDKEPYIAMLDKRTNNIISVICDNKEELKNTTDIVIDFFNRQSIIYTDGNFIYAKCENSDLTSLLEGHNNILDNRLKKTQATYRHFIKRNADYIKSLEPEERDAANVLLKIKLKD